jgi:lysophospholipase
MRPSPKTAYRVAAFFTAIGLGEVDAPGEKGVPLDRMKFDTNPLTSDRRRFDRNVAIVKSAPQLAIGAPTFAWLYAACSAMHEAEAPEFAAQIKIPTLIIGGSIDTIVSLRAMEALAAELRAGAQVVIPGARHEIMMERDSLRAQFFAAFDAFIPGTG